MELSYRILTELSITNVVLSCTFNYHKLQNLSLNCIDHKYLNITLFFNERTSRYVRDLFLYTNFFIILTITLREHIRRHDFKRKLADFCSILTKFLKVALSLNRKLLFFLYNICKWFMWSMCWSSYSVRKIKKNTTCLHCVVTPLA